MKVKMLLVRNYINKKKTFGGIIKHFISFISSKAVYVDRFTENWGLERLSTKLKIIHLINSRVAARNSKHLTASPVLFLDDMLSLSLKICTSLKWSYLVNPNPCLSQESNSEIQEWSANTKGLLEVPLHCLDRYLRWSECRLAFRLVADRASCCSGGAFMLTDWVWLFPLSCIGCGNLGNLFDIPEHLSVIICSTKVN